MFPPQDQDDHDPGNKPWGGRKPPFGPGSPLRRPSGTPSGSPMPARLEIKTQLEGDGQDVDPAKTKKKLWDLLALTISMAGAQVAWTVELGYGTPFLLGLGLSEQLTSLVWLAGPISGLIAQPLIGEFTHSAISDSSNSKYRRRYWVVASTVVLTLSALTLAYALDIAGFLVEIFSSREQWEDQWKRQRQNTAIGLAVGSFYLLDFALNALQGSLRNLLLDVTPAEQLGKANAWHGRMTHAGNIIGFAFGFADLADWKILRPLGGDQFRKVCIVATAVLIATVWITVSTQHEKARKPHSNEANEEAGMREAMKNISRALSTLPRPVRRVCYVQVCAFMGWFPFLFYSTTWVGEIMAYEQNRDPTSEEATRAGEFALLIYSVVAVVAGTALPYLAAMDARLLKQIDQEMEDEEEELDAELVKIREMVKQWKTEAARKGRPLQLPRMPFMLRNIWTAALVLFGVIMMSTFFITTVFQATIAIALLGICWAVACWVPFAIIMQFLREMDDKAASERKAQEAARTYGATSSSGPRSARPFHSRVVSTPAINWRRGGGPVSAIEPPTERTTLVRRHSMADVFEGREEEIEYESTQPVAGGTILGIHNLAIVVPQFLIALISSLIFRIVDQRARGAIPGGPEYVYFGKNGVSWVLRFGGICAFLGAAISRRVPPTKTEKEMRWRLAEMQEEKREAEAAA